MDPRENLNIGNPGNKGGGRLKSKIREACAESFKKRIPILEKIADDTEEQSKTRIQAIEVIGKYGGLQQIDHTTGDEPISAFIKQASREELLAIALQEEEDEPQENRGFSE